LADTLNSVEEDTRTEEGEMPALFEVDDGPEEEDDVPDDPQGAPRKGKFGKLGKAGGKLKRGIRSAKQKVAGKLGSQPRSASSSNQPTQNNANRSRSRSGSNGPREPPSPTLPPAQMTSENFDTLVMKISDGEQELQDAIRLQVSHCDHCISFDWSHMFLFGVCIFLGRISEGLLSLNAH
jgi:hypothetical protein